MDDPLLAVWGTLAFRRLQAGRFIACLLALGVRLAFPKAQLSSKVVWIGVELDVQAWAVEASIPADKLRALMVIIRTMLSGNIVSAKDVRSLSGRRSNIATLLYMWRPFLVQLWASLSTTQTNAPPNTIWTCQIEMAWRWLP